MKKCSYCGKEVSDEAMVCPIDGTPFVDPAAENKKAHFKLENLWVPYLVLCSISVGFNTLLYLTNWQRMDARYPGWSLTVLRFIVFLRIPALVAVWWGSRSGVVAFVILGLAGIFVMLAMGIDIALLGLIGATIFVLLVERKWQQMSWPVKMPGGETDDTPSN